MGFRDVFEINEEAKANRPITEAFSYSDVTSLALEQNAKSNASSSDLGSKNADMSYFSHYAHTGNGVAN